MFCNQGYIQRVQGSIYLCISCYGGDNYNENKNNYIEFIVLSHSTDLHVHEQINVMMNKDNYIF